MTLGKYIQNINAAYNTGIVLDGISVSSVEELKELIVADVAAGAAGKAISESALSLELVKRIQGKFGLTFVAEEKIGNLCFANNNEELRDEFVQNFSAIDVLDFLYGVLHASKYRIKANDFLKIEFSKISFPTTVSGFRTHIVLGRQLRQVHTLEGIKNNEYSIEFTTEGDCVVNKPHFEIQVLGSMPMGKLWINDIQYLDNVPEIAWNFNIGGYMPVQKWIKDREGNILETSDIGRYQKIIVALCETELLMRAIDTIPLEET